MEHIFEKEKIATLLDQLQADTPARWGMMTPQHMVEHLRAVMHDFLHRPEKFFLSIPEEKVSRAKASLHDLTREMPQMFRPNFLPADELLPLEFSDLPTAKAKLFEEIEQFHAFFKANPTATRLHPYFGELDHEHWLLVNNKHFYHHFKQFGLVA